MLAVPKRIDEGPRTIGKDSKRWIAALYDHERPPERNIKMNGERSYHFSLGSGVAQGARMPTIPIVILLYS
jgi:hypothetical protein|tara:strand:- start:273 stop:485 length:213 start_codon:yes stop_codon:yes gene_type:complete